VPDVTADQWKELDDLRVIRNCLVHKNGQIDPTDKDAGRLEQIIAQKQGIEVGYDDAMHEEEQSEHCGRRKDNDGNPKQNGRDRSWGGK